MLQKSPTNIKTYKIYKYVHNSSKVPNDSCGCKKQAICHYLQIKLNAHEYYKNILSNLEIKAENRHNLGVGNGGNQDKCASLIVK